MTNYSRPTAKQSLVRMLMLLIMMVVGNLVFLGLAGGLSIIIWDYNFFSHPGLLTQIGNTEMLPVIRFFQGMQTVGMFLFPAIFWVLMYDKPLHKSLQIRSYITIEALFGSFLLVIIGLPMINALAAMNEAMNLPDWLDALEQSMRNSEDQAMEFMEALLDTNSIGVLLSNLLIIGILPSVAEEVFFRGVLQNELERVSGRPILAVLLAALVFAALHFQFYTFLPRFVLGVMLGLVYLWSRNIWVPIALHFFNNGLSVLAWFWFSPEEIEKSVDNIGTMSHMWFMALISIALVLGMMYGLKRHFMKHRHN